MPGLARVGDSVKCGADAHGFPPWVQFFTVFGRFTSGSPNTYCNSIPAVRVGDNGFHVSCPGPMSFIASSGAARTYINNRPAVRAGDSTLHCGLSTGNVYELMTSLNTIIE